MAGQKKSKKGLIIVIVAVVVVAAIAGGLIFYFTSPYTSYSRAFDKTTKVGSMEYNITVEADLDGDLANATSNMKIRDISTNVNFINVMEIEGQTITQFTDGENIYQDKSGEMTAFEIGDVPDATPRGDFNLEFFVQEFSSLLDASKLKELQIADKLTQNIVQDIQKNGNVYTITLAPQLVEDLIATIINSEMEEGMNPTVELNSFVYTASESNGYISNITYDVDADVTFPKELTGASGDETKNLKLTIDLEIVNPGTPVEFDLPSTDGYTAP